ncbi:MAG: hypothetical protein ABUT39_10960 [Acidobacteriota bacterium]
MHDAIVSPLAAWEGFYVIIGSSAAALTGLQFVVMALVAEQERAGGHGEIDAFGTPTVVHFCAVLLLAAIVTAPWQALPNAGLALGAAGLAGLAYSAIVLRRARRQAGYKPVFEDWLWHTILPFTAYGILAMAAMFLSRGPEPALFWVGAAALLLLFVGIHNAWDTVTYIAIDLRQRDKPPPQSP